MYLIFEKDPERKKANRMLVDGRLSAAYTTWNRVLVESQGPYILGNKLTHADFWLAHFVSVFDDPMVNYDWERNKFLLSDLIFFSNFPTGRR